MSKMHPDLMRASGLQPTVQKSGHYRGAKSPDHPRPGYRMAPSLEHHRLSLPVRPMSAELRRDPKCAALIESSASNASKAGVSRIRSAMADSRVDSLHCVLPELGRQPLMRPIVLGDDEQPSRILVNPVNDSRTSLSTHAGKAASTMGQKSVDERSRRRSRCRMHNHSCGLVYNEQVTVFKDHIQRNAFRSDMAFSHVWNHDFVYVTRLYRRVRVSYGDTVAFHRP